MTPVEVAEGVFLLALPLGIHRIPSINAYLFTDPAGDTLIDCGIYAGEPLSTGEVDDGTGAVGDALAKCGRTFDDLGRLIITHAHIDHYGIAGEVVRRSGADLWMHAQTDLDRAKYAHPDSAVDRRSLMLADHGLLWRHADRGVDGPARLDTRHAVYRTADHTGTRRREVRRGRPILGDPAHPRPFPRPHLHLVGRGPLAVLR